MWSHAKTTDRQTIQLWSSQAAIVVCLVSTLGMAGCREIPTEMKTTEVARVVLPVPEVVLPLTYADRYDIWMKLAPTISLYQKKQSDLIWECMERFCKRMDAYKPRAGAFASESMSLSTKWEFAKSKFAETFTNDPFAPYQFEFYVRDLFEKQVISSKEIQREVESCFIDYVERYNALDNEMILKIQADLYEVEYAHPDYAELATPHTFQQAFHQAFEQVTSSVAQDTGVDVIRMAVVQEIGSALAVRLATSVATRLGISEVLLGSGAVSGATTLGISVVGAIALDWLVGELLKEFADYDPERDIRDKVEASIEQVKMQLMGKCAAGVHNAFCRRKIDDLYGVPSYPEQELKEALQVIIVELEKEYDMGLTLQLMMYQLNRAKFTQQALAKFFFKEDAERSAIGRWWKPNQRPEPTAEIRRIREMIGTIKTGGQP
jgi:hypothetical protein